MKIKKKVLKQLFENIGIEVKILVHLDQANNGDVSNFEKLSLQDGVVALINATQLF